MKTGMNILDWIYDGSDENTRLHRKFAFYEFFKTIQNKPKIERLAMFHQFKSDGSWRRVSKCNLKSVSCPRTRMKEELSVQVEHCRDEY